jgi:hypothetical protein
MPKAKHQPHQKRLKVGKSRHAIQRFRGRRARGLETVSRVYSQRFETKAISPMVAYKPYTTEQLVSGESTAIYAMKYDPKTNLLWITFWGYKQRYVGSTYVYYRVPYDIWVGLNEASSKGRFFYYNIRTSFQYSRVK